MTDDGIGTIRTSVIVPSYRRAARLERLIQSVLPQLEGRTDRELIVVDDASNDPGYAALAAQYRAHVRLVTQAKNAGPSAARNAGARVARGDYLIFTDDDCVAPPYWLDWFDSIVATNPDADLIGGYARPLPHEKRWTPTRWAPEKFMQLGIWYDDEVVVLISSCHIAVKRRWFERIGGFREAMRWAEDRNLTYRLRRAGAIIYTDPSWHVYHESESTWRQHLRRRVGYGKGAYDQIAREWPALDKDDWPGEGNFLQAFLPRVRNQLRSLRWYWTNARVEKRWPPGYVAMAALTALAMDLGYIRARREHRATLTEPLGTTPFGILHEARSGGALLADLLQQCPGIRWVDGLLDGAHGQTGDASLEALRERISRDGPDRTGFGIEISQLAASGMTPAEFLRRAAEIGVDRWILLTRRNRLRQLVSAALADATGRDQVRPSDPWQEAPPHRVTIDPVDAAGMTLADRFRNQDGATGAVRTALAPYASIELVYEDDIANAPLQAVARLTPFLQLPDYDPVVRHQRLAPWPLREIVANYEAVAAALAGNEFAWMLED